MLNAKESSEALILARIIRQKLTGLHNKLSNAGELSLAEISLKEAIREAINIHHRQPGHFLGLVDESAAVRDGVKNNKRGLMDAGLKTEQLYLILSELKSIFVLESKLYAILREVKRRFRPVNGGQLVDEQERITKLIYEQLSSYEKFS